ncbi:hypothetical protein DLAC_10139 [Tieghemostelium lacteum]|uniref:OTU domain-containing protein n=1 Tax=Tieghemostelium lacteum TaxID=361077 RepID=A0A151Z6A6_TIELA|nr:hypothetical protein DLAC_10139 [Tieghemostelium lacteum]|eukprot:KYQ89468.1 hypothetical protein DLAC_10139 [Tieghemostelium lacteum]
MQNLDAIDKQLKSLGLVRREIPKDGSCLFRCISESIYGTQNYHRNIRMLAVKYIKLNRDSFEPFACVNYTWDRYIDSIQQDGTWGGELELQAISVIFQVNFIIYLGTGKTQVDNGYKKNIQLAYCHGEHYDLVYTISHYNNYKQIQTFVYDIMYRAISPNTPHPHEFYCNIPLLIWEKEDQIKQKRDSVIVDKLSQIQGLNILDEYQLKQKKKKPAANNSKLKTRTTLGPSVSPTIVSSSEPLPLDDVDEEFKEILRQIEQQELEEQRLIGLEKHFPTLGPKGNKQSNKSNNISPPLSSQQLNQMNQNDGFEQIPEHILNESIQSTEIETPNPVSSWGVVQDWSKIVTEVEVSTSNSTTTPNQTNTEQPTTQQPTNDKLVIKIKPNNNQKQNYNNNNSSRKNRNNRNNNRGGGNTNSSTQ